MKKLIVANWKSYVASEEEALALAELQRPGGTRRRAGRAGEERALRAELALPDDGRQP